MKTNIFLAGLLFTVGSTIAQTTINKQRVAYTNVKIHVGNGTVHNKATVGVVGGTITKVDPTNAGITATEWDTIIDANGQEMYPGFVAPNSTLGLTEIDAVRSTRDFSETGIFNPHVRSIIAYNCESRILETVRTNGVLLTQSTPKGGVISGQSSVMRTNCWNWEDGIALEDDGIHLYWPSSLEGGGWWAEPEPKKLNDKYAEKKREIIQFFVGAKAYLNGTNKGSDIRYEALRACFSGTKRVYIHAEELQQIMDVIDFAAQFGFKFPVLVGGYDSYLAIEPLKKAGIPVMLQRLHSLPQNEGDAVDLPYRIPALLQEGGVRFCIQNEGDMEAMHARNIPFLAGTAMAYGLTEEQAVRSVSLSSCEIMGLEKNYGSIEVGKKATFFVSKGSALDMKTNKLTSIIMDGQFIPIGNFQADLYQRYKKKFGK